DAAEARRRRAVPDGHELHRVAFAAGDETPHAEGVRRADRVAAGPEAWREAAVHRLLHEARPLAVLDLPAGLTRELKVEPDGVDRPAPVRRHEDAVVGVGDELVEGRGPFRVGLERDVDHADDRRPRVALGAHAARRTAEAEPVRGLARREVAD